MHRPAFPPLAGILAALWLAASACAADSFNTATQAITIPGVVLGSTLYTNVVATLGQVLAVGGGQPYGTCDSYDPVTNQLTIPAVQVNGTTYANVLITVGTVSQVGGRVAGGAATCSAPARNVLPMVVDQGPTALKITGVTATNEPFVSVTVCVPGSATACQTIDHVLVDTGSVGLRVIASALPNNVLGALPQELGSGGYGLSECVQFASNASWGSVRLADVQLAGETAGSIPIQIIGDPAVPPVPSACSNGTVVEDTVASFGANGVLGVQPFLQDCGISCVLTAEQGYWMYWICPGGACQTAPVGTSQQLPNPVAMLAQDNNGVVLTLPSVPGGMALSVTGTLTLGIATAADNALGRATVYDLDPNTGNFTTLFNGQYYTDGAFVDSGSNALYFADGYLTPCSSTGSASGFYCPSGTVALSAYNQGYSNGNSGTVAFSVANAEALFTTAPADAAFSQLAGSPIPGYFDWGLPFFFGNSVFLAFDQSYTAAGPGPYVAY